MWEIIFQNRLEKYDTMWEKHGERKGEGSRSGRFVNAHFIIKKFEPNTYASRNQLHPDLEFVANPC